MPPKLRHNQANTQQPTNASAHTVGNNNNANALSRPAVAPHTRSTGNVRDNDYYDGDENRQRNLTMHGSGNARRAGGGAANRAVNTTAQVNDIIDNGNRKELSGAIRTLRRSTQNRNQHNQVFRQPNAGHQGRETYEHKQLRTLEKTRESQQEAHRINLHRAMFQNSNNQQPATNASAAAASSQSANANANNTNAATSQPGNSNTTTSANNATTGTTWADRLRK